MSPWFVKLMQQGRPRARSGTASARASARAASGRRADAPEPRRARDPRHDELLRALRERGPADRAARERRQRGYRQSVEPGPVGDGGARSAGMPARLHRVRTKVPCRATPEGLALLADLRKRFPDSTVTFPMVANGRQAMMLSGGAAGAERQVGWLEHRVETDPARCNVRHQGLSVDADGSLLVLRFLHPRTGARVASPQDRGDDARCVDFREVRPALDLRLAGRDAPPRLVWLTRRELATIEALQSRDYEAFYVRFKLELLAGIWGALTALLSGTASVWHRGAHYTTTRELDAATGRIRQRTLDDEGRAADIGADREYDAAPATDILLLQLGEDILADIAAIYFTLQDSASRDAYFVKEEFFAVIRRFWQGAESLRSSYGSEQAAVVRMALRAVPMPAQVPLLQQDWINLRQSLVDRYGEEGRRASTIAPAAASSRAASSEWPFATYPAGAVNLGLGLTYRQEWRRVGSTAGEIIRTIPAELPAGAHASAGTIELAHGTRTLDEIVDEALRGTLAATKWSRGGDGSIGIGLRELAAATDRGPEVEASDSSAETSSRLDELAQRMVNRSEGEPARGAGGDAAGDGDVPVPQDSLLPADGSIAHVHRRLQHHYEVHTGPAELRNVVLVAEPLPAPEEIDPAWVRRHARVLAGVLLDESVRDVLVAMGREQPRHPPRDDARERLCEHLRANILHYQRAIWQQEDPQQRGMRYRQAGMKVPLEWRFELETGGAVSVDALAERLAAPHVAGQFAAYAGGREADLDEVIDPAGPVGYHANYAIYHMRPEFGGDDSFAMLHFFKSPWLHADARTGTLAVADPAATHDRAMDPHRARRARARRITVDTSGIIVEVIRPAPPAASYAADEHLASALRAAADGFRLIDWIRESGRGAEALSVIGPRAGETSWHVVPGDGTWASGLHAGTGNGDASREGGMGITLAEGSERPSRLCAGAGPGVTHAPMVTAAANGDRALQVCSGRPHDPDAGRVLVAASHGTAAVSYGAASGAPAGATDTTTAPGTVLLPSGDGGARRRLHAGKPHDEAGERVILARGVGGLRLTSGVGGEAAPGPRSIAILARGDEWLRPSLVTG